MCIDTLFSTKWKIHSIRSENSIELLWDNISGLHFESNFDGFVKLTKLDYLAFTFSAFKKDEEKVCDFTVNASIRYMENNIVLEFPSEIVWRKK